MAAAVDTFSTSSGPLHADDVKAPSLSTSNALARFEYESDKPSNDATKVLMVEWIDDAEMPSTSGQWHISWEDRHSVLPAEDSSVKEPQAVPSFQRKADTHRMFFLLGAATPIPPKVSLEFVPSSLASPSIQWHTYPLPAIFPPELGASAREAGKKGVLHTLWAKKRLSVLSKEIDEEYKNNFEGIGLEMAIQERDWIISNFGVSIKPPTNRPTGLQIPLPSFTESSLPPQSPQTPRSPGGGRLLEKMRGLKIGTSSTDWGQNYGVDTPPQTGGAPWHNPLSPETSDVAASGFEAIKGSKSSTLPAATSAAPAHQQAQARRVVPTAPPPGWRQIQASAVPSLAGVILEDKAAVREPVFESRALSTSTEDEEGQEDDLFQLPMSPRSPDHAKSPFSFAKEDVQQSIV